MIRCRILPATLALSALLLLGARTAAASSPATWEYPARGAAAASEGGATRVEGIAIWDSGALSLSWPLREIYPGASKVASPPILWTTASDPAGNIFVGSGNAGEVIRIDPKGVGAGYADTEEMGVRALAVSERGDLFVATFPTGGVYRIAASGALEPFFDPEDRYIWAMAFDPTGPLYVATGERGIIYKVTGSKEGKPFFDSSETHIMSLAVDGGGRLLAGTSPGGLLFRISKDGKAELLLDTDLGEISAVTVTPEGTIFAAATGEERIQLPRRPGEKGDLTIEVTPASDGNVLEEPADLPRKITIDLSELVPAPAHTVLGTAGRLYRLDPGRSPVVVWKSDTERIYGLAWSALRGLVFSTGGQGSEGRIYRLEPDGSAMLLHRLREPQVTALLAQSGGKIYACTSNPGRIYLLDAGSSQAGTYVSSIYDAGHQARWGSISWSAETPPGTRLELSTRSGNRPDADETWSSWSPPCAVDAGSPIASPPARYIQWKAELSRLKTDASPLLRQVKVTLLPENRPPSVRHVAVLVEGAAVTEARPQKIPVAGTEISAAADKGADGGAEKGTSEKTGVEKETAGKGPPPKGFRWVAWSSSDPDGDTLSHTLWLAGPSGVRGGNQDPASARFVMLASGVASSPWAFDDARLAEGFYILKVEADDAATNGLDLSLRDLQITDPFVVDHTAPRLEVRRPAGQKDGPSRMVVEVAASDALSPITRGEYSVDAAGAWTYLPCRDGICDTLTESFRLDIANPGPAARITIRVTDAEGNAATVEVAGSDRKGD